MNPDDELEQSASFEIEDESVGDEFQHVTGEDAVNLYTSASSIFEGIFREVRELSKKKPEATMNGGKVRIVNRVLNDLISILSDEPAGKYLEILDDESLPQVSDAVLTMVQFETALNAFQERYHRYVAYYGSRNWITREFLEILKADMRGE